jgi:uncharacterized protein (TIGR03437 family)
MDRSLVLRFLAIILLSAAAAYGATYGNEIISDTNTVLPGLPCYPPTPVTSFLTTQGPVYLYFEAATTLSDRLTSDWLAPDGTAITGDAWQQLSGSYCYSTFLTLGPLPANRLGTWQARVYDNGALQFVVPFTISSSGGGPAVGPVITTVAGGGWRPFPKSQIAGPNAPLGTLWSPVLDRQGNLYVADSYNNIVVRIAPDATVTLVAGNGNAGFGGDGGPPTAASLSFPSGLAVDSSGNLYISDKNNNRIRKISGGIITTVAGTGKAGNSGDGGPAAIARLNHPAGIALDATGNLYIADQFNHTVREITGTTINTIAGNGAGTYSGDGGLATSASFNNPESVAVDAAGNVYIVDSGNNRIRLVRSGIVTTVAGTGSATFSGDGGPAAQAALSGPSAVALDAAGNIYISDFFNERIRKISNGVISTVVGNGARGFSGDGGSAIAAVLNGANGVTVDASGALYVVDYFNGRIRKVVNGNINTVAGNGTATFFGDGGPATSAGMLNIASVALDKSGNLYIADGPNNCIRRVSGGIISTFAGTTVAGFSGDGGPAASATFNQPVGIAFDSAGNLYIADSGNHRIRKVSNGIVTTVVGTGTAGFAGDNGPATRASLNTPFPITVDSMGNLYIGDTYNYRIRKVSSSGTITTVAGNGVTGYTGDGGPATNASIGFADGLAVDAAGNLFFADTPNNVVRRVSGGRIDTVAGSGLEGFLGDGGPALLAELDHPEGVSLDAAGNLLISDTLNNRIRRVTDGMISTIAGSTLAGFGGDGGSPLSAGLSNPSAAIVDGSGNIFIADTFAYRVREILITPPSYQVSPASLTFSANAGGSATTAQTISLSSAVTGLAFTTSTNVPWLTVTPTNGSIPGSFQVVANPGTLAANTYTGTITITSRVASPATTTIQVKFTVQQAVPPQLSVGSQSLSFTALQNSAPQTGQLQVSNTGGGSLAFTATASTQSQTAWLSVTPSSSTAKPGAPASLTVTATPGNLIPGTYQGAIAIAGGGATSTVMVTLSISTPNANILISQSGLSFTAVAQGGAPLPQSFGILNTGQGSMNWSASANTLSGGNWLQISPTSGSVAQPFLDVSTVNVAIDPTGLAAGNYYGRIQVTAAAVNSPQLLTVILTVLPPGSTPGPEVRPSGLIFTGIAGASPGSQDVQLGNPKAVVDNFKSNKIGDGFNWLPASAQVMPNQPGTLRVFPDYSQLQPGSVQYGTITLQFDGGLAKTLAVLLVVAPANTSSERFGLQAGNCSSPKLEIQLRAPANSFNAVLGQATTIEAQIVDDCGNLIGPTNLKSASVTASFSNKDNDITLNHIGNGIWTGSWKPVNATPGVAAVSVTAFYSTGSVLQSGQASLTGTVSTGVTPTVTSGGVVHAASGAAGVPIAPGSLVTIYGSNLSNAEGQSSTLPLPQTENGTQVLLGNTPLPILYTSKGQVNVQVPFSTPVNTQYQISVQKDNVLSVPEQLVIAAAQPGVFTLNQQGSGQGVIFKSDGVTLADVNNPATVGETVVIYCTGLGAVNPPVAEGMPAPSSPLSHTVNQVTVSIGGQDAIVDFSGLTPGYPGLYQVNARVPNGVSGSSVPVTVSVTGQTSPQVTMAVQ